MKLPIRAAMAIVALCLGLVGPVLAQAPDDPLPPGPGKDVVVRVCTACHDASEFAFARYTPEEWDNEIAKMEGAGAEMTAEEQVAISTYLAKNFSKPAPAAPADAKPPSAPQISS
jgi:cytochrome c5